MNLQSEIEGVENNELPIPSFSFKSVQLHLSPYKTHLTINEEKRHIQPYLTNNNNN